MTLAKGNISKLWLFGIITSILAVPVMAAENSDDIDTTVRKLQIQLNEVQSQLQTLQNDTAAAGEWQYPDTIAHVAGFASINYVDVENGNSSYSVGNFSPIFHFQYRDLVMLESELEFSVKPDGETDVELEYLTIDWFINDYMVLVAGKYLSPIGMFRQNLHPSWINKLPSAPPGFGHDGAAPASEMGIQLRGAFPTSGIQSTYAIYVSNGPELNAITEDGTEYELEGIVADGFGADRDGNKVYGGRFSVLPLAGLELAVSVATGKASVTKAENELDGSISELSTEDARDYDVIGTDISWRWKSLGLRAEFVRTDIGSANGGTTTSPGSTWQSWYTQAAYQLQTSKLEPVLRYTDFDSPHASEDKKQWALGLNYLFANNFIGKLSYEFNDGVSGSMADDDKVLVQLAYGF